MATQHKNDSTLEFPQKQGNSGYKNPPRHTRFKPGQSGNPGGLPRGTPKVSAALMKLLGSDTGFDFKPKTRAEQIAWALYNKAADGDVAAIRELSDRTEGKAPQSLSVINQTEVEKARARFEAAVEGIMEETGCSYELAVKALLTVNPANQRFLE